jgi:hypothetical protein
MRSALSLLVILGGCGDNLSVPGEGGDGDGDGDGDVDGGIAATGPTVSLVDYPVIAHGGALFVIGSGLDGATSVEIGGVVHRNLSDVSGAILEIDAVDDTVPTGPQPLTVTTPRGTSEPIEVVVIHLVISEVEVDSPGADIRDFIELDTGVAESVSLDNYLLVIFEGEPGTPVLEVIDLDAATSPDGLMLIGPETLAAPPQIVFEGSVPDGEDAIAIYQYPAAPDTFPASFAEAGTDRLIDALVYETAAAADQPELYPLVSDAVVVSEGDDDAALETASIQRCPSDMTRRLGASYRLEIPTPGRANVNCDGVAPLADCMIDFDAGCPVAGAQVCGASFVGAGTCAPPPDPQCGSEGATYTAPSNDNRVDVFLSGELDNLETFLAVSGGIDANMRFFALDGTEVGSRLDVLVDCSLLSPPSSNSPDLGDGAVRRIQISGDAALFVDSFRTNPTP